MKRKQVFKLIALMILFKSETAFADINLQEGSFTWNQSELLLASPKERLSWERSYSSRSEAVGILGLGWCTEFEWSFVQAGSEAWLQKCDDIERISPAQIRILPSAEISVEHSGHSLIFSSKGILTGFLTHAKDRWSLQRNLMSQPTMLLSPRGLAVTFTYTKLQRLEKMVATGGQTRFQYDKNLLTGFLPSAGSKESYVYDDFFNLKVLKRGTRTLASVEYFDAQDTVAGIHEQGCSVAFKYETKEEADFVRDRVLETRTCPGQSSRLRDNIFQYKKTSDHQVILENRTSHFIGE